jgi:uncharacterized protein YPO0396
MQPLAAFFRANAFHGFMLRYQQEAVQGMICSGMSNHLPEQQVILKKLMGTFIDTSCAIATLLAKLSASSNILMGSLFFNTSEAQLLKLCDNVSKDFKPRLDKVEQLLNSLKDDLCVYGQSCSDACGSETLKNAQDKLEECKLNLNKYIGELEIAEGKLKGLEYFQKFLEERPDLTAETCNQRIKQLLKSCNELQSRKDSVPSNVSSSTRIRHHSFWFFPVFESFTYTSGVNYDSDRQMYQKQIDCCNEEIARLQKISENVSKTRAEEMKATGTEIGTVKGKIMEAKTSLRKAKKEYDNADRELEKLRAEMKSTNLETLRQIEAIGKAVMISVAPMASDFSFMLYSIEAAQQNANSLNQYHFMLEMSRLAVSAAAYRGDGLLLDHFLPDSYVHRTKERVDSIITRRDNSIGPIHKPALPGGGERNDVMNDWE